MITQVIRRPRCPKCDTRNIFGYATKGSGQYASIRYYRCRECGERFKVVRE